MSECNVNYQSNGFSIQFQMRFELRRYIFPFVMNFGNVRSYEYDLLWCEDPLHVYTLDEQGKNGQNDTEI